MKRKEPPQDLPLDLPLLRSPGLFAHPRDVLSVICCFLTASDLCAALRVCRRTVPKDSLFQTKIWSNTLYTTKSLQRDAGGLQKVLKRSREFWLREYAMIPLTHLETTSDYGVGYRGNELLMIYCVSQGRCVPAGFQSYDYGWITASKLLYEQHSGWRVQDFAKPRDEPPLRLNLDVKTNLYVTTPETWSEGAKVNENKVMIGSGIYDLNAETETWTCLQRRDRRLVGWKGNLLSFSDDDSLLTFDTRERGDTAIGQSSILDLPSNVYLLPGSEYRFCGVETIEEETVVKELPRGVLGTRLRRNKTRMGIQGKGNTLIAYKEISKELIQLQLLLPFRGRRWMTKKLGTYCKRPHAYSFPVEENSFWISDEFTTHYRIETEKKASFER